ncbi:hypothetical protein GW17_00053597 [Ensete ventricosum]|nr:hypothetical protein GW17_00053597 [Ensete ventricosum]
MPVVCYSQSSQQNNRYSSVPLAPFVVHLPARVGRAVACSPAATQPHEGHRLYHRRYLLAIHSTAPIVIQLQSAPTAQAAVAAAGRESGSLKILVCFIILDIGRAGSAAQDCSLQHLLLLLAFSTPPLVDNLRACALAIPTGLSFSRP